MFFWCFLEDRTLPELIGPYNEYTSFLSNCEVDKIFETMKKLIAKQDEVDYEFSQSSYKVRGRKFINHLCAEWRVSRNFSCFG